MKVDQPATFLRPAPSHCGLSREVDVSGPGRRSSVRGVRARTGRRWSGWPGPMRGAQRPVPKKPAVNTAWWWTWWRLSWTACTNGSRARSAFPRALTPAPRGRPGLQLGAARRHPGSAQRGTWHAQNLTICARPPRGVAQKVAAQSRRSARYVLSDHPQPRHSACSLSLDQAQSLRAKARASRGSSCMPCNSRPWPGVARGGSTSSFVGRLSPTVVPNRWLRAPDLAPAVLWASWWGHGGRPSGPVHPCLFVVSAGHRI